MEKKLNSPYDGFELLQKRLGVRNDAALSRLLGIAPPNISKMRAGIIPIGPAIILRIHDETDLPIAEIKEIMGVDKIVHASRLFFL